MTCIYIASPAPQVPGPDTTLEPSKALQSGLPTESGLSTDSIAKAMSWYKNTHRDDFALYPFDHRDAGGWQPLSAAANALMKFHPEYALRDTICYQQYQKRLTHANVVT
jgi:hypothetical protein